ncbi:MAG: response regulator [Bernardetiaceae bacterium]|nr:response regulator [Bernardetiaceae bacterium]
MDLDKKYTILYVDDEESNLRIFRSSFRKYYQVLTAISAPEGRKILGQQPVQLLITDQKMPFETGIEFLESIMNDYPDIVRIVLTGYSDIEDITRAINQCKIFHYLVKPWDKEEMKLTIDKGLESYQLKKDNQLLLAQLKASNEQLEEKVKARTAALMALNQDLEAAKNKAEEASKAKEQFLSTMSHEIRTPLNAIIGMVHLLKKDLSTEEIEENLEILQFSSESLLTLINDILDLTKIEAGKIVFEKIVFAPKQQLFRLADTFKIQAQSKGLSFAVKYDERIPNHIIGDPARLKQIIGNLLSNALKFTEKGAITLDITLLASTNEMVKIAFAVIDTGIGIPADKLAYVFQDFSQAQSDTTRKYGGTGLGLAICKRLAEKQGGRIEIASQLGQGSKFTLYLDFHIATEQIAQAQAPLSAEVFDLKHLQVLLVEDNKVNQVLAKKFLSLWKAQCDIAQHGKDAVEKVQKKDYDIVLMDLQMPIMDGYEATRIIRAFTHIKQMPIIALTASALTNEQQKVKQVGMNGYIMKPFNPATLYHTLEQYIQN